MILDIPTIVGLLGEGIAIIRLLQRAISKKELKDTFWKLIEEDVEKAEKALDELSDAVVFAFGANLLYSSLFEPRNPELKAKQIFEDISRSYRELMDALSSLSETILDYQEEFRAFFAPADWAYIKGVLISIRDRKIIPRKLSRQLKARSLFQQTKNKQIFQQKFSEYLDEFNSNTGLDELNRLMGLKDKEYHEFVAKFLEKCLKEFFAESEKFRSKQKNITRRTG
ncbi:hypothetical protein [Thermococcus sp.]|uniref:hypothetical protein n=1 Tax=Thermococcus sp. TaxID=35749 RepID=UPI0025FE9047|nr:hypothetical protein [Thermococcus sp.]